MTESPPSILSSPWESRPRLGIPLACLVALAFALYGRTLSFGFTYLDDNALILSRSHLLQDPSFLWRAFREDVFQMSGSRHLYRPVLTWTFALDAWRGGLSPGVYHLTNVLLHALACGLLLLWLRALLPKRLIAAWGAFLFCAHPLLAQAAAWVPGRNDSLMLCLVLPSFLLFIRRLDTGRAWDFAGHLLLWSLALLTKETAAVLPGMCLLYKGLCRKEGFWSADIRRWTMAWAAVLCAWILARRAVLGPHASSGAWEVLAAAGGSLPGALDYLGRALLPWHLSVYASPNRAAVLAGAAAAILLGWAAASPRSDRRLAAFGAAWFLAWLCPSIAQPHSLYTHKSLLNHRIYAALPGLLLAIGSIEGSLGERALRAGRWALPVLTLALAALTWGHTPAFRDRLSFWRQAAETSPSVAFVRNNLGAMHFLDGNIEEAIREWLEAADLSPREPLVHGNLGLAYMRLGRLREAEGELRREIALNPGYDHAPFNLGLLYYQTGHVEKALELWERVLALNPYYADAYANLIVHHLQRGRRDAALAWRQQALANRVPLPPALEGAFNAAAAGSAAKP